MGTATKHPVPDRVKPSFERQSARMSKITNDGLTRSGTGCFVAGITMGVKGEYDSVVRHYNLSPAAASDSEPSIFLTSR